MPIDLIDLNKRIKKSVEQLSNKETNELGKKKYKDLEIIAHPPIVSVAPFPLDRLKLDGSGVWSSIEGGGADDKKSPYDNPWWPYELPKTSNEQTPACVHNWVEIGFNFTKIVCSKCNMEKP